MLNFMTGRQPIWVPGTTKVFIDGSTSHQMKHQITMNVFPEFISDLVPVLKRLKINFKNPK
jgi:hypothetical protein